MREIESAYICNVYLHTIATYTVTIYVYMYIHIKECLFIYVAVDLHAI